ncbi:MAG: hypothetical protein HON05_05135, partial [Euryarchaeota archaeon]|nr:hypothetical protein [Euryarchaeota archaeon]
GLACRVLLPELGVDGAETGLPKLAMEQLNPFLGGLILASIFAATMSTADSQVLACTAAITDDVRPEWSQDHKTTKRVTLAVAVFATVISLVGQQMPGFGDSVFELVVLAVYGLGAIFVPLLLVRMTGYEPDSKHTIAMMISAMSGVVVWTLLGFDNVDGIFPTVPGMGAAFATHFGFCWLRSESPNNPFGRYAVPAPKPMGIGAVVILLLAASIETSYHVFKPEASESLSTTPGSYEVVAEFEYLELDNGGEYIEDGGTFALDLSTDSLSDDSKNIVGARMIMTYSEDETSAGIGCLASGGASEADTITGFLSHSGFNGSESGQNQDAGPTSHDTEIVWYDASLIGNVTGVSMADIEEGLNANGAGLGAYSVEISVDVSAGGAFQCTHEDNGENVDYVIELIALEYTVIEIKE